LDHKGDQVVGGNRSSLQAADDCQAAPEGKPFTAAHGAIIEGLG
jgi:hypothetical protein